MMVTPLADLPLDVQMGVEAELREADRTGRPPPRWRFYGPPDCTYPLAALPSRAYYEWRLRRRRIRKRVKRQRIIKRDGMVCGICKTSIQAECDLHIDHILPIARGGSSDDSNLQPTHAVCNRRKGALLP